MGIQFGWGLQMANMSPIYEMLGQRDELSLLWIAAPLTGLLVQPIVGISVTGPGIHWGAGSRISSSVRFFPPWRCWPCRTVPRCGWRWACCGSSTRRSTSPWSPSGVCGGHAPRIAATGAFFRPNGADRHWCGGVLVAALGCWPTSLACEKTPEVGAFRFQSGWPSTSGAVVLFVCVMVTILTTRNIPGEPLRHFAACSRRSPAASNIAEIVSSGRRCRTG